MTCEVERIAKGLTGLQAFALLNVGDEPQDYAAIHGSVRCPLFDKGLLGCVEVNPPVMAITPLGKEVRQHLLNERSGS